MRSRDFFDKKEIKKEQSIVIQTQNCHVNKNPKHKNKYAAIDLKTQRFINVAAEKINLENKSLIEQEKKIWNVIQEVLTEAKTIRSCDLPTDDPMDSALVFLVQKKSYSILSSDKFDPKTQSSLLNKIFKVAELSEKYLAGNCQEKSFYAFQRLIQKFVANGICTPFQSIQMELIHFTNHFAVIVNNQFLIDPLFGISFVCPRGLETIKDIFKNFGPLERYFVLGNDWNCYFQTECNKIVFDQYSTLNTLSFFKNEDTKKLFEASKSLSKVESEDFSSNDDSYPHQKIDYKPLRHKSDHSRSHYFKPY